MRRKPDDWTIGSFVVFAILMVAICGPGFVAVVLGSVWVAERWPACGGAVAFLGVMTVIAAFTWACQKTIMRDPGRGTCGH